MTYTQNVERQTLHCSGCQTHPHLEIRPGIGVVATCDCNRTHKMEFTGQLPGEWE